MKIETELNGFTLQHVADTICRLGTSPDNNSENFRRESVRTASVISGLSNGVATARFKVTIESIEPEKSV